MWSHVALERLRQSVAGVSRGGKKGTGGRRRRKVGHQTQNGIGPANLSLQPIPRTGHRTRLRATPRARPEEQLLRKARKVDALRASCWRLSNLPAVANSAHAVATAAATGRFADRSVDETDGNQTKKCVHNGAMKRSGRKKSWAVLRVLAQRG